VDEIYQTEVGLGKTPYPVGCWSGSSRQRVREGYHLVQKPLKFGTDMSWEGIMVSLSDYLRVLWIDLMKMLQYS
jgi:hypothetical protein